MTSETSNLEMAESGHWQLCCRSGAIRGLRGGDRGRSTTAQVSDTEILYSLFMRYKHPPKASEVTKRLDLPFLLDYLPSWYNLHLNVISN